MAINRVTKSSNKFAARVDYGCDFTAAAQADTIAVSAGAVIYKGTKIPINAVSTLALTAPATSGNLVRNYIRVALLDASGQPVSNATPVVYATTEGATATAILDIDLIANSTQSADSQDHYKYLYLGFVDVDDDAGTADADVTQYTYDDGRGA